MGDGVPDGLGAYIGKIQIQICDIPGGIFRNAALLKGQAILEQSPSIQTLAQGLYLLKMIEGDQSVTRKWIKKWESTFNIPSVKPLNGFEIRT